MKYKIIHDMPGRVRVRCGRFAFTLEESYKIDYVLERSGYVEKVKSSYVTGSILIYYKEEHRDKIFELLSNMNSADLALISETNNDGSKEIDIKFKNTLLSMISRRFFVKLFIPMSIGKFLFFYKSIRFIKKGLKSLFSMNINVNVLDAASIGAAMVQKEYSTAGSIMFLLNISDLLEEYTRKKTKNVLAKSLAINVDSVWLANNETEILIPALHVQIGDKIRINAGHMIPMQWMA